jgi:hypothetical protein
MEGTGNNRYLRSAVLVVICLVHGSLIIVLARAKLTYALSRPSELITTIYFISPESSHTRLAPVENSLTPHRLRIEPARPLLPESLPPGAEAESPLDAQGPPAIDWLAEAQRSTAEIIGRARPERPAATPLSPTGIAPWDPHSQRLEATGHGLKFRIIDRCFADLDLGQTVYGPEERLQLGCHLKKKPARGDLFDSLRKPQTK